MPPASPVPTSGSVRSAAASDVVAEAPDLSRHALDAALVEPALRQLARATRQFRTYPATSPMCVDAVSACTEALQAIEHRDQVNCRVTPSELVVDDMHVGSGTVIEQELTRRLHRLRVSALDVDRHASRRDLSRFCMDLVQADELSTDVTFAERLAEHGVNTIVPLMAQVPAVLDVGAPSEGSLDLVARERERQAALADPDAPVDYLYPPDRGWVRVDPSAATGAVSLLDLVVLVDDPVEIASMLDRLTGGEPDAGGRTVLERKYSDIRLLFSALDPRMAQVMFSKLARAVLDLEPERRTDLLQRNILPGLLDGQPDGAVLREFPDLELAESICLLMDLETAAPEVLSTALDRLNLEPERREGLTPLIDTRLAARRDPSRREQDAGQSGFERHARTLTRVDAAADKDFSEFAAFDLSMDAQGEAAVTAVREGIAATDTLATQLLSLAQLARIERNPDLVEVFLARALVLVGTLERLDRWGDVVATIEGYARLGAELAEPRPDVADAISRALAEFCSPSRMRTLGDLLARDDGRTLARSLVMELRGVVVPGFIGLLHQDAASTHAQAWIDLMSEMAPDVAPALVERIDSCEPPALRVVTRLLGLAGAGHELTLSRLAQHADDAVSRGALEALARVGTPRAAAIVARQIRDGADEAESAAEQAFWAFAPAVASVHLKELLGSNAFIAAHPRTAVRLLERAGRDGLNGLDDTLAGLERHRFTFWKPRLMRVGRKAREVRVR